MKETQSNSEAWSLLSEDHYNHYKARIISGEHQLNPIIKQELGEIGGKDIIHLQCNTGADSLLLAKKAHSVTGVDLVERNIYYATKMAEELGISNTRFITRDVTLLIEEPREKYDIVFTSEGVLGWLKNLDNWALNIKALLKEKGYLYLFDSHPFFMMLDESLLSQQRYDIKYPYFGSEPDISEEIGGYAGETKHGVKAYFWMHTVSEIINSLLKAGLQLEFFNEHTQNFYDSGNMRKSEMPALWEYPYNTDKYPMTFSLKASLNPGE